MRTQLALQLNVCYGYCNYRFKTVNLMVIGIIRIKRPYGYCDITYTADPTLRLLQLSV